MGEDSEVRYAEVYSVQKSYMGLKPNLQGNWMSFQPSLMLLQALVAMSVLLCICKIHSRPHTILSDTVPEGL